MTVQSVPYSRPFYIFCIIFPAGISQGFVTVTLPYLLSTHGFSVSTIAGIVALAMSANLWRFLWGPLVDMSLSIKKWYWISLIAIIVTLLALCFTDYSLRNKNIITLLAFVSQIAATFLVMPITALMAQRIAPQQQGAAAGWYQAGSLAGTGIGGGAGLWLATGYSMQVSGVVLSVVSLVLALCIMAFKDVVYTRLHHFSAEIKALGKDMLSIVRQPLSLFVLILVATPIGSGACANLWSAIGSDWQADVNTIGWVTGVFNGLVSAVGCVAGGYIANKSGVLNAYMVTGLLCAATTFVMAFLPYTRNVFIGGVLCYAFCVGMVYAAFSATIMYAIGKKNVATKYAIIASFGNLSVVYVTAINGWVHDHYNSMMMLLGESALGALFVCIAILVIRRLKQKNLLHPPDVTY